MVGVATIADGGGRHDVEGQELPNVGAPSNGHIAAPIPTWRTLVLLTAMVLTWPSPFTKLIERWSPGSSRPGQGFKLQAGGGAR